ncbi:ATP-binding protein [Acinetobacter bereziniae]|uniref:ATP-binding protein n=3 Tax=Acinetobacter bereziniae TaxID=106648 RepID=UPI0020C65C87|nr:ATP-binding protein [Acinetobacter bereziniae]
MSQQDLFETKYDQRFLDKFLGNMIKDPIVATVELIANAYDAGAKNVYISWPTSKDLANPKFEILDDGKGLALDEFKSIWNILNYDRISNQGNTVSIFDTNGEIIEQREVFGKNGKGRFSAFCFNDFYQVVSVKDGNEFSAQVSRSINTDKSPLQISGEAHKKTKKEAGIKISTPIKYIEHIVEIEELRKELSARFISRPSFKIFVNKEQLNFNDIPSDCLISKEIFFKEKKVILRLIDTDKADISTKQRGVAWWVHGRLVGGINWSFLKNFDAFDQRKSAAKKYNLIIEADCLHSLNLVLPDWSGFDVQSELWSEFEDVMIPAIKDLMDEPLEKESKLKANKVLGKVRSESRDLGSSARTKLISFVDEVVKDCPSLNENTLFHLANILINLEKSSNKFNLLQKLSTYKEHDLDNLYSILNDWGIDMAKVVLDEIQGRLKTIAEFKLKMDISEIDEVHELQVLFNNSLWMFGPQFESIEYTSNKGMTHALKHLFKQQDSKGSRNRPDYLILPDGTVGFYSLPAYNDEFEVNGVSHLIIIDLKTTDLKLGTKEVNQVWKYVVELREKGAITANTAVQGFVLGDCILPFENDPMERGNVKITPMLYRDLIIRSEKRMLGLFNKVKEAPLIQEHIQKEQSRLEEIYNMNPELAY